MLNSNDTVLLATIKDNTADNPLIGSWLDLEDRRSAKKLAQLNYIIKGTLATDNTKGKPVTYYYIDSTYKRFG